MDIEGNYIRTKNDELTIDPSPPTLLSPGMKSLAREMAICMPSTSNTTKKLSQHMSQVMS